MLKKIINIALATTVLLGSLGTISYAVQTPISPNFENNIAQTRIKPSTSSIVTEGFEKLCSGHTKDAYTLWLSHSIPMLRDMKTQITESLASTQEKIFGKCTRYIMIGSVSLTEKTQIVYLESEHEKAPLFWQFVVYQTPQGWEISSLSFHTNPSETIPASLLNRR
ncbi:hypothetical protein B4U84_18970 [Westiellopsis prolifica IICB1]|nr:hypothetical protein B4U84_18970 [Westiellopsis prolifica IICB1]